MDFIYPCKICIVNACCRIYCIEHFKFMNKIINGFPNKMSREQIEAYYESTPMAVKSMISGLIKNGELYSFSEEWKSELPQYITRIKKYRAGSE